MIYMGIDPGYKGGIAFYSHTKNRLLTLEMPVQKTTTKIKGKKRTKTIYNCYQIKRYLEIYEPDCIVIEKQHLSAGDGKISNTAIVGGYNLLKGMAYMYLRKEEQLIDVHPLTWHKAVLGKARMDREESKRLADQTAIRLFPNHNFKRTERCKINHDCMIDAALLAWYGFLMRG